jgi:hypothetical protein
LGKYFAEKAHTGEWKLLNAALNRLAVYYLSFSAQIFKELIDFILMRLLDIFMVFLLFEMRRILNSCLTVRSLF